MSQDLDSDALMNPLLTEIIRTSIRRAITPPPLPNSDIKSRNLAQSKFLSLPAEIRYRIYSYSLVSVPPITVWSARFALTSQRRPVPRTLKWDRVAMAGDLRKLSLSLLQCSTSIAAEAAHVFYSENTFCFFGDHEYYPVITWLDKIGQQNRECLKTLEISVNQPERAWQLPDGSCLRRKTYRTTNGFATRHPQLAAPAGPGKEGEVDIINPAMETIISLLAGNSSARRVTLYLHLSVFDMPGVTLIEQEDMTLFSMDLPNLVEKWRTAYFSNGVCGSLEVIWIAESARKQYIQKRSLIEDVGWDILQEADVEVVRNRFYRANGDCLFQVTRSLLRRKPLTGPPIASDPDPYTDWQHRPEPLD
ncbi:MAG: hypothetical protein LQ338_003730 [Usnochroma carphineum]|nr:MAG: hypothetical protein LQ338_003730 [Usnochroma carphineum]